MYYQELLKKMLLDMENAPLYYQATHYWKVLIPRIVSDLEKFGFENFKSLPSSTELWIGIETPEACLPHYSTFHNNDDATKAPNIHEFSEDLTGNFKSPFEINKRSYTPNALSYLKGLAYLKKHVDTSIIKNVLEIGGGYGVLGEMFLKALPEQYFYVDIDIPPLSAIATYYLQTIFGKDAILDYNQSRDMRYLDIEQIRKNYRGMVLCPWQLPKLRGNFELATNFVSFQEMEPEVVENYARYIDALTSPYLLMRNSRHGKQIAPFTHSVGVVRQTKRENYLDFFSSFQLLALDSKTFGYTAHGGFESEVMVMQKKNTASMKSFLPNR